MTRISIIALVSGLFISQVNIAEAAVAEPLVLPVGMYNTEVVPRPLAFSGGECPEPRGYPLHHNQILAELLLLCNALKLGGMESELEFKDTIDYLRIITNAGEAKTVMPGFVVWGQDINRDLFYVSDPVLKKTEFTKGIYTTSSHKKLLQLKNPHDLTRYLVAINPNWKHDNTEIECVGLRTVSGAFNPITMARMVAAGRADFLLFPFFGTSDLSGSLADIELVPVPGVKMAFSDSLHFIVSKKHPQGLLVFNALQKGLAKLHADGTVHSIYAQLGFFNPQVRDWVELGCTSPK